MWKGSYAHGSEPNVERVAGNGKDLAAVAVGVDQSGSKLVDVTSLPLYYCPKKVKNPFPSDFFQK